MALNKDGRLIASTPATFAATGTEGAIVIAEQVAGGWHTHENLAAIQAIHGSRINNYMIAVAADTGKRYEFTGGTYNTGIGEMENGSWGEITFGGGGGSAITVQEEGADLTTSATTLNFVGTSITASGDGAIKTITVTTPTGAGPDTATLYAILLSGGFTQLSKGTLANRQQYTGALAGVSSLTYYWDSTSKGWFAADTGGTALIAFP